MWIALANGLVLGLVWALVMTHGEGLLLLFGQEADLARGGGRVLLMFAPGMPAIYLFTGTIMFLEAIGRPRPGMVVTLIAIVVNAGLNWGFIHGHFGFGPQGAAGAVLATSVTRWIMFAAIFGYVMTMRDRDAYGVLLRIAEPWRLQRRFLKLGVPMALSYAFETSAFTTITMMAGAMGALHVAGFQVAMNYNAFCFMMSIGMATATTVRVGNAVGRQDRHGMRVAGWTGAGLILVAMTVLAIATLAFRPQIAAFYTSDPAVLAITLPALMVTAALLVGDGMQAVLVGALRGAADVWTTTLIGLSSFWFVMVPGAWFIGVHLKGDVPGLMWGEVMGVATAAVLLTLRFNAISKRSIRPV